jgi:branched-chain amino acid transport system substrate-binding protein
MRAFMAGPAIAETGRSSRRKGAGFPMEEWMSLFLSRPRRQWAACLLALPVALAVPAVQAQTLKIGAPLALTGGLADEGKKQQVAYDMWLKRVNAAGGITVGGKKVKVELITYDYQTNEQRASQIAEKLITQDKVDVLTAPFGSGHTKVVAGVAERYGVPVVASVASSESVFNQGYKFLFGTLAPNGGLTDALVKVVTKQMPTVRKIALLGREDVFPKSMAASMADAAKRAGIEIVYNELYPVSTMDFSSPLSKMRSVKPDWIFVSGYTKDLVLARKQMADLGVTAPVITMITGPAYREFAEALGPLAENVTSATWWSPAVSFKSDDVFGSTQAFVDDFRARGEKGEPDYVHASAAAALIAVQKAAEIAGSLDKTKLRDALAALELKTFYGPIDFTGNGMNAARELPIIQVQGGRAVVLAPEAIRQSTLRAVK